VGKEENQKEPKGKGKEGTKKGLKKILKREGA
jgi:hypothetical protein